MTYIPLSFWELAISAVLVLLNGALSWRYSLRIERTLAIASLRMIVQLALVAIALRFIFAQASAGWTVLFASVVAIGAIAEVISRQQRRLKSWRAELIAASPAFLAGPIASLIAMALIQPDPWYAPRYLLPILGMLVGNAMSGVALVLDSITHAATRERREIEPRLALGASRYAAFDGILGRGLRTGLMPILNAMAAAGIVSLPGMMTGQILAGVDPLEAAKYQIMIMFLIAGATALGVIAAAFAAIHALTDDRHRLRLDRLRSDGTSESTPREKARRTFGQRARDLFRFG